MNKIPDFLYHCFASADRDLRAGEKVELETFRTAKAEREAREEFERSKSALMIKARNDVAEKLSQKDIKGAISARLPWLKNKG